MIRVTLFMLIYADILLSFPVQNSGPTGLHFRFPCTNTIDPTSPIDFKRFQFRATPCQSESYWVASKKHHIGPYRLQSGQPSQASNQRKAKNIQKPWAMRALKILKISCTASDLKTAPADAFTSLSLYFFDLVCLRKLM